MKLMKGMCVIMVVVCAVFALSCASSGGGGGGAARGPGGSWTFDDPEGDTQGWELANSEFYMYRGSAKLSRDDATLGKGLLRLDVDFTESKDLEWSEPKMKNDFPRAFNMKGITKFEFDFYYNPSFRTDGGFKAKVFSNSNGLKVDFTSNDIEGGEDAGNGFLKVPVTILIMPGAGFMTDMRLSIAGYLTDYNGPVFFDNLRWE
jgi:hypothetical protein